MEGVRVAEETDKPVLAAVLKRAFEQDPVMRWILPSSSEYQRVSQPFFEFVLNQSQNSGTGFTTPDQSGVSLWEKPDHKPSLGSQLLSFINTAWLFRSNLTRALNLQSVMESYRPRTAFWHLTYLATDPSCQGHGIGARLLKPVTRIACDQKIPIYLECSNQQNLSFYRGHGFRLIDEISYPHGPTIWPMILDHRTSL